VYARIADLKRHMETKKHNKSIAPFQNNSQKKINILTENQLLKKKRAQAKIAMFIAVHSTFKASDHLSKVCTSSFEDSEAAGFKLHRTKCQNIVVHVIANHFQETLVVDIQNSFHFSLLLDESTDITVDKMLGFTIRYFSEPKNSIVSTFLGLNEVDSGKAEDIVNVLIIHLQKNKIDIKKLKGIGSDNASTMVGSSSGVQLA
jgi:hypothetical protein